MKSCPSSDWCWWAIKVGQSRRMIGQWKGNLPCTQPTRVRPLLGVIFEYGARRKLWVSMNVVPKQTIKEGWQKILNKNTSTCWPVNYLFWFKKQRIVVGNGKEVRLFSWTETSLSLEQMTFIYLKEPHSGHQVKSKTCRWWATWGKFGERVWKQRENA